LATRYGEEGGQLAQTHHDGDAGGRDDKVTEEKAQGTASSERSGGAQKETSTDDTTDTAVRDGRSVRWRGTLWGWDSRDHLSMTVLQPTMELAIRTNLILLDTVVVDGFFLVLLGHLC